jgi:hypothetical protein
MNAHDPLVYVTYVKVHPVSGQVYVGRIRGHGTPDQLVADRDRAHELNRLGYGPARLDVSMVATRPYRERMQDRSYLAIRGREHGLIESARR